MFQAPHATASAPRTPIPPSDVEREIERSGIRSIGRASIRELVTLVNRIEAASGEQFIRMEMGVPGIEAPAIGIEAEIAALRAGVASRYPMLEGIAPLKQQIARFCDAFLNLSIEPQYCLPSVGSAQGALAAFMVGNETRSGGATLFLDPGFPNQKRQLQALGQPWDSFDVYAHRGAALEQVLEQKLSSGRFTTLLYSNPNNPTWICFDEQELRIIAEVARRYDVIVIEDLAYFGMDYRADYSIPGQPPYPPSIARYSDNYLLLISSSKVFSYAGQRIGCVVVSDALFNRRYPTLNTRFNQPTFGRALIYGALHALSSGVTHSVQYGLAAMLKAANDGQFRFLDSTRVYADNARHMKQMFTANGFRIVYDRDNDQELADGFYFTFAYPGFSGAQLLEALLYYGISALSLESTGAERREGLRACVSQIRPEQLPLLEARLRAFHRDQCR